MILLRPAIERDVRDLAELAKFPGQGFYGLPKDEGELLERIKRSQDSFSNQLEDPNRGRFLFVAEDLDSKKIVGTSSIRTRYGSEANPNFYFEVGSEKKYSETIKTGFIHGTLNLKYDTNGPSEIGGLVVHPDFRGSELKIGRQTSFVRFLFMGLNRSSFKKRVMTELLPPFNKDGKAPLWEAIGRRFANMDYWEADRLATQSKEFILSLFPTGKIYTTFLTAEARDAIGKVGEQTKPVFHMLTKIGFSYDHKVDPFDGGPFLSVDLDEIRTLKTIQQVELKENSDKTSGGLSSGLICFGEKENFKSVHVHGNLDDDSFRLSSSDLNQIQKVLNISSSQKVHFMTYY